MKEVTIDLFAPLPPQATIAAKAKRFTVIPTGRRVGKSEGTYSVFQDQGETGVALPLISPAFHGKPVGIFSCEFKDVEYMWEGILKMFAQIIRKKDATLSIVHFYGGGSIEFFSITNEGRKESGRGRKFVRIIVEETQKVPDRVLRYWWNKVGRHTLMDYRGDAFFIGNANGQGTFFHELARRGGGGTVKDLEILKGDWKNWITLRFTTYDNPLISKDEIEEVRQELDDQSFLQEIMAEFVNYAGDVWCYAIKEMAVQNRIFVPTVELIEGLPVVFSFDFNKRPMTALAMQFPLIAWGDTDEMTRLSAMIRSGIHVVREFKTDIKTDASIYDTCRLIREWVFETWGVKIGNWAEDGQYLNSLPIFVTGDASGNSADGRQSDPTTYYQIIASELGLSLENNVRIMNRNPLHAESYVKINSNLKNNPDLLISTEHCPALIKDMYGVLSDKFRGIEKTDSSLTHFLDCLRYGVHNFA